MTTGSEPDGADGGRNRGTAMAIGAVTLFASGIFRQGLGLVTLAVTARLLTPEDFGVIAYFLIIAALIEMLHRQMSLVLIRLDTVEPAHFTTIFTFQVIFSGMTALLLLAAKPLVALFGIPDLVELLPVLACLSLIIAIRSPRFFMFDRQLVFRYAAIDETLSRITHSVTAIVLAWLWRDYWALVVATFAAQAVRGIYSFATAPILPRFDLSRWRDAFSFASWTAGAQLCHYLVLSVPQMMIGVMLGLADAGIFRLGNRIAELVSVQVFAPLQRVIYPGLADATRETDRKFQAFSKLNQLVIGLVLPISIGMALIAPEVIRLGLGAQWLPAVPVIAILGPLMALETLGANVRAAFYIDGSDRTLFMRNLLLLVIVILLMWIGLHFGFAGALAGAAAGSLAGLIIVLYMARQFSGEGFFAPIRNSWRSFAACAAMIAAVLLTGWALSGGIVEAGEGLTLAAKILVGAAAYTATHLAIWHRVGRPEGFETMMLGLFARFGDLVRYLLDRRRRRAPHA